jgi:hypothetical protein
MANMFRVGTNTVAGGFVMGMLGDIIKKQGGKDNGTNPKDKLYRQDLWKRNKSKG